MYTVYTPLDMAQNLTGLTDKVSQTPVKCVDPFHVQEVAQQVSNSVSGISLFVPSSIVQMVTETVNIITYFFTSIGLVAVTVVFRGYKHYDYRCCWEGERDRDNEGCRC